MHITPERGAIGIAEVAAEIDVFDHYGSARTQDVANMFQSQRRIGDVRQYEARVDKIEVAGRSRFGDVTQLELDVCQVEFGRLANAPIELGLIENCPQHAGTGANDAGNIKRQIPAAATDFQNIHARLKSGSLKQSERCRAHDAGENAQALSACDSTANDIGFSRHDIAADVSRAPVLPATGR